MFKLTNRQYDIAKDTVTVIFPALSALYAALAGIWGLSYSVEVVGTIAAVGTALGLILKVNTTSFAKENTVVPDSQIVALERSPAGVTLAQIAEADKEAA